MKLQYDKMDIINKTDSTQDQRNQKNKSDFKHKASLSLALLLTATTAVVGAEKQSDVMETKTKVEQEIETKSPTLQEETNALFSYKLNAEAGVTQNQDTFMSTAMEEKLSHTESMEEQPKEEGVIR